MVDTITSKIQPQKATRRRWPWVTALVLVVAGAAGLFYFFGGSTPAEVNLEETASAVGASSIPASDTTAPSSSSGIEGAWAVDTSIGDFVVDGETTATFAGFRVAEVLSTIGETTAVGRTPEVTGSIEIEGTTLTQAEIVADLTQIVSNQARRQNAIQRALGTGANPTARFVLTSPVDLGEAAADGEVVSVRALGELTINGVTQTVEIPIEAQLLDRNILVTGSLPVVFADFGVEAPTAPIVVSVEDNGTVEMQVWLTRA